MLNKVMLIGHLGADPECRSMPSGDAVANLRLATTERYKDRASGEMREATEWHRVSFFGRLAEVARDYLKKGWKVYVEGRIKTRQWEKDGQKHYSTEIVAERLLMLGSPQAEADTKRAAREYAEASGGGAPDDGSWGEA